MLSSLITSKTRLRMLIKFFVSDANKGYLNGLANEFNESTNSIRKELNNLSGAGYLLKSKKNTKICLDLKFFVLGHFYQTIFRLINQKKSTILFLFLHLEK